VVIIRCPSTGGNSTLNYRNNFIQYGFCLLAQKGWSTLRLVTFIFFLLLLQACKHPLAIVGEGDIVDLNKTGFGCTLAQFNDDDPACANDVQSDYLVNYSAVPHPGWRFSHWDGACGQLSEGDNCRFDVPVLFVDYWDTKIKFQVDRLTAVFVENIDISCGGIAPDNLFISGFAFTEEYVKIDADGNEIGATEGLVATYERKPYENGYHRGTITKLDDAYLWRNELGIEWLLFPQMSEHRLLTNDQNPYFNENPYFDLHLKYAPCPAPFRELQSTFNGLTGHFVTSADGQPNRPDPSLEPNRHNMGWGMSMYSTVYPLRPDKADWTQLGWGTWMEPNPYEDENGDWLPVPVDTDGNRISFCADGGEPSLFQSNEGGVGSWGNVDYPIDTPMFIIAATSDCYTSGIGGPAYTPNAQQILDDDDLYFAQLSNRLLLPPGAVTFEKPTEPELLGYGWLALPIIPKDMSPYAIPTGTNSWTLFFNARNFKGAVGFFTPAFWTAVNRDQDPWLSIGYGMDTRGNSSSLQALEVGFTNAFTAIDDDGTEYRRIPRMTFGVNADKRAGLLQDYTRYSKAAIFNNFSTWLDGGASLVEMDAAGLWVGGLQEPDDARVAMLDSEYGDFLKDEVRPVTYTNSSGGEVFGLEWTGSLESGVIPEYYKNIDSQWMPIDESEIIQNLHLADQTFPELLVTETPSLDTGPSSAWDSRQWAAGPYQTNLNNGSTVEYVWYRFVDQPAISRLPLSASVRDKLQSWAEAVHDMGVDGLTIPPPSSGSLISVDERLMVTPPAGLERGYIPIAIAQWETTATKAMP
jgi:hypothetical protein